MSGTMNSNKYNKDEVAYEASAALTEEIKQGISSYLEDEDRMLQVDILLGNVETKSTDKNNVDMTDDPTSVNGLYVWHNASLTNNSSSYYYIDATNGETLTDVNAAPDNAFYIKNVGTIVSNGYLYDFHNHLYYKDESGEEYGLGNGAVIVLNSGSITMTGETSGIGFDNYADSYVNNTGTITTDGIASWGFNSYVLNDGRIDAASAVRTNGSFTVINNSEIFASEYVAASVNVSSYDDEGYADTFVNNGYAKGNVHFGVEAGTFVVDNEETGEGHWEMAENCGDILVNYGVIDGNVSFGTAYYTSTQSSATLDAGSVITGSLSGASNIYISLDVDLAMGSRMLVGDVSDSDSARYFLNSADITLNDAEWTTIGDIDAMVYTVDGALWVKWTPAGTDYVDTDIVYANPAFDGETEVAEGKYLGHNAFTELADAVSGVNVGGTVVLENGAEVISGSAVVSGKDVNFTGAAVMKSEGEGFFAIGRTLDKTEAGDAVVTFDNATLESADPINTNGSYGFNIGGAESGRIDKANGTLNVINGSDVAANVMLNSGTVNVDASVLTVQSGFSVTGEDNKAVMNITDDGTLNVYFCNGMGIGWDNAGGELNLTDSTLNSLAYPGQNSEFLVGSLGVINAVDSVLNFEDGLVNKGTINLKDCTVTVTDYQHIYNNAAPQNGMIGGNGVINVDCSNMTDDVHTVIDYIGGDSAVFADYGQYNVVNSKDYGLVVDNNDLLAIKLYSIRIDSGFTAETDGIYFGVNAFESIDKMEQANPDLTSGKREFIYTAVNEAGNLALTVTADSGATSFTVGGKTYSVAAGASKTVNLALTAESTEDDVFSILFNRAGADYSFKIDEIAAYDPEKPADVLWGMTDTAVVNENTGAKVYEFTADEGKAGKLNITFDSDNSFSYKIKDAAGEVISKGALVDGIRNWTLESGTYTLEISRNDIKFATCNFKADMTQTGCAEDKVTDFVSPEDDTWNGAVELSGEYSNWIGAADKIDWIDLGDIDGRKTLSLEIDGTKVTGQIWRGKADSGKVSLWRSFSATDKVAGEGFDAALSYNFADGYDYYLKLSNTGSTASTDYTLSLA